jgi:aminopeptidase N
MVEYFSDRFGYPYAWPKYDQITLREFEGAMETATMVGFTETYQRQSGDPVDSGPDFTMAFPTWMYEDTIAHELAHHWFGDLVTCRSLGSIWLNESFATYAMARTTSPTSAGATCTITSMTSGAAAKCGRWSTFGTTPPERRTENRSPM